MELYQMINPIEHSRVREAASKYKVEPYVIPADIYGSGNLAGRGGWTWYTGSSSWFYKAGIEYILGLKIINGCLTVKPCVPKDWKEYYIRYKYKNSIYDINVRLDDDKENNEIFDFYLDGIEIKDNNIKLIDDGRRHEIRICSYCSN